MKIHDNFYDYSETTEILPKHKVKIICPVHGLFEQNLYAHLKGAKCLKCRGSEKWDVNAFLSKARIVHGDRYDYSMVVFVDRLTKVNILCKEHGVFQQSPAGHCKGAGCSECWKNKRRESNKSRSKTTEQFIKEAKEIHGDFYDYSLTEYISFHKPLKILCNIHGIFEQTPASHLYGSGCPECGIISSATTRRMTNEDFINRVSEIYPDYDFSSSQYSTGSDCIVDFICPVHGLVSNKTQNILYGEAKTPCPDCNSKQKTLDEFKRKSNELHKNRYDYSLVNYNIMSDLVDIVCPIHGVFKQSVSAHISGKGCYSCYGAKPLTEDDFLERATNKFGTKYDYSKVVYDGVNSNITISCPTHGSFQQTPRAHLESATGCKACSKIQQAEKNSLTQEEFERRCNTLVSRYKIKSIPKYKGMNKTIDLICEEHGEFKVKIPYVLYGKPCCPECTDRVLHNSEGYNGYFYINVIFHKNQDPFIKFGVSYDPPSRFKQFLKKNKGYVDDLITLDLFEFEDLKSAYSFEQKVKTELGYTPITSYESLPDGFTETCNLEFYKNILKIGENLVSSL